MLVEADQGRVQVPAMRGISEAVPSSRILGRCLACIAKYSVVLTRCEPANPISFSSIGLLGPILNKRDLSVYHEQPLQALNV